jgi:hypothetical protein
LSEDTVEVLVKIGNRSYEGKLHQKTAQPQVPDSKRPMFPEPYGEMLLITDAGNYWTLKPRQFLQTSDFAEIARLVKQFGGEYVSAGKSSHFRIPK